MANFYVTLGKNMAQINNIYDLRCLENTLLHSILHLAPSTSYLSKDYTYRHVKKEEQYLSEEDCVLLLYSFYGLCSSYALYDWCLSAIIICLPLGPNASGLSEIETYEL